MPTFVQQDLWKAMSAVGIVAMKRCFLLNGTYITEPVPWAAPLRACGLPDAVFLAISATSACRDLHLEGEEGGGERRFSSTALPPVPEVADSGLVNASLLHPPHRTEDALNAQGFSEVVPHHVSLFPFANTSGKGCFWQPWKQAGLCQSPRARCKREADRQPPSAPCYQQTSAATLVFHTAAHLQATADPAAGSPVPSLQTCLGATPTDCTESSTLAWQPGATIP